MEKKFRVCLLMKGGSSWMGGAEYVKNVGLALSTLIPELRNKFELYIIYNKVNDIFIKESGIKTDKLLCYEDIFPINFKRKIINAFFNRIFGQYECGFESFVKNNNIDVVFPSFIPPYSKFLKKVFIGWIPDFQHVHYPEFFSRPELSFRTTSYARMAKKSKTVVLSSKDAQRDFGKLYPDFVSKTVVVNFATVIEQVWFTVDPVQVQKKYGLPDKFFIISNQFWKHKNHKVVFDALNHLKGNAVKPIVVCTGSYNDKRNPDYFTQLQHGLKTNGLEKQVFFIGLVPKEEQVALLRRSIAVIQPSLFEGWSTVVENVKAIGKSLILSELAVHKEQNPPDTVYFDPLNPVQLSEIILKFWDSVKPGPDSLMEEKAREFNKRNVAIFGENVYQIFKSAIE